MDALRKIWEIILQKLFIKPCKIHLTAKDTTFSQITAMIGYKDLEKDQVGIWTLVALQVDCYLLFHKLIYTSYYILNILNYKLIIIINLKFQKDLICQHKPLLFGFKQPSKTVFK